MAGIIGKLFEKLVGNPQASDAGSDPRVLPVYIKCSKCGEPILLRVRKTDEVQRDYDGTGCAYYVQKTAMGSKCFNRIPIRIEFNEAYKVTNKTISGGTFIDKEEYETLVAKSVPKE